MFVERSSAWNVNDHWLIASTYLALSELLVLVDQHKRVPLDLLIACTERSRSV